MAEKEKVRKNYTNKEKPKEVGSKFHVNAKSIFESSDLTSDEEEENLVIDTGINFKHLFLFIYSCLRYLSCSKSIISIYRRGHRLWFTKTKIK